MCGRRTLTSLSDNRAPVEHLDRRSRLRRRRFFHSQGEGNEMTVPMRSSDAETARTDWVGLASGRGASPLPATWRFPCGG
jgi:hypothetical protein